MSNKWFVRFGLCAIVLAGFFGAVHGGAFADNNFSSDQPTTTLEEKTVERDLTFEDMGKKVYAYAIEVNRGSGGFYIRTVSSNGKIVEHGEILKNKADAIRTAWRLADGAYTPLDCTAGRCEIIQGEE